MAETNKPRVALARVSGRVEALVEENEEIDAERLTESFNKALENADVESETLRVSR
jgi:hypothetical protein